MSIEYCRDNRVSEEDTTIVWGPISADNKRSNIRRFEQYYDKMLEGRSERAARFQYIEINDTQS